MRTVSWYNLDQRGGGTSKFNYLVIIDYYRERNRMRSRPSDRRTQTCEGNNLKWLRNWFLCSILLFAQELRIWRAFVGQKNQTDCVPSRRIYIIPFISRLVWIEMGKHLTHHDVSKVRRVNLWIMDRSKEGNGNNETKQRRRERKKKNHANQQTIGSIILMYTSFFSDQITCDLH